MVIATIGITTPNIDTNSTDSSTDTTTINVSTLTNDKNQWHDNKFTADITTDAELLML